MSWCTIESDPGVFSELIQLGLGVPDVSAEEIYSLDSLTDPMAQDVSYGLIFLFKWRQEVDNRPTVDPNDLPGMFFARQVVTNACATQAILSVLLNADSLTLPDTLANMREFTMMIDSESKGIAIGNSEEIRIAHNSFARPEPIIQDETVKSRRKQSEDVYHFIAYIPFEGRVYEVDGLKAGPIDLGEIVEGTWLDVAKPAIEARMNRYSASETHFALMTICPKKASVLSKQIETLEQSGGDPETISRLKYELSEEGLKEKKQRAENIRRRHNYLPLTISLIRALAKSGQLQTLRAAAVEKKKSSNANKQH